MLRLIEADWLRQAELRFREGRPATAAVTPEEDAVGALDGVKNGKWGFHTQHELKPWWQIDLEKSTPLDKILLYNRTDFAARNARIMVLLSDGRANVGSRPGFSTMLAEVETGARVLGCRPRTRVLFLDTTEQGKEDFPARWLAGLLKAERFLLWRMVRSGSDPAAEITRLL